MTPTAKYVTQKMKADRCHTASRSSSKRKHHNYSNKYTQKLGQMGYKGIAKNGYFTKFYDYGVVGHCCIGVQYWFIECGLEAFVPKSKGYIWNTNQYMKWLRSEPKIEGYGKVNWVKNPKNAKLGAVAFKGQPGHKSASHTCVFLFAKGDYVYTVDFNVSDGLGHNNGTLKKRHKKYFKGFANMPYPKTKPKEPYIAGHVYTLQSDMNIRSEHSTKGKKKTIIGKMPKGKEIAPLKVYKTKNGVYWLQVPFGTSGKLAWVCAKTGKKTYIK